MVDSRRSDTADRVRAAALALFAAQGYEATTLADIAVAVGIRKPSLYNHIDSKEALFMRLVEDVEAQFFAVHDASLAASRDAGVARRLFELVSDLSAFIYTENSGAFYQRCLLFPPAPLHDAVRRVNTLSERRIDAALQTLFEQGCAERAWRGLSERSFIDAFYCLVDGLFAERFVYSRAEYERRLHSCWRVFWAGLTG